MQKGRLKQLMTGSYSNGVYFSGWLRRNGYSDQFIAYLRKEGWLYNVCRGVSSRIGCKLLGKGALACFNEQEGRKIRVSSFSALRMFGYAHYGILGRESVWITPENGKRFPSWIKTKNFDCDFTEFRTRAFSKVFTEYVEEDGFKVLVSSPEMAIMECLVSVKRNGSLLMDIYHIFEQMNRCRETIVQSVLESTKDDAAKRLFLYMAEKANHWWLNQLNLKDIKLGHSLIVFDQDGEYIEKYNLKIPKELYDYQ